MLHILVASAGLNTPSALSSSSRRSFLGKCGALVALKPLSAFAAVDCMTNCQQNCNRNAPGSKDYCKESCLDYCAQPDRKDGLSGSVSSDGAEVFIGPSIWSQRMHLY